MQLGDWVEFDTVLVKERTATGSRPGTQTLSRTRYGMVVGIRPAYETTAGSPPRLINRQNVLVVAVSLHTVYRVLPADARPIAGPPARRARARRSQPAAPASTTAQPAALALTAAQTGGAPMRRQPISKGDLEVLVADELNRRVADQEFFTAYDITIALREANPADYIEHVDVRRVVHEQMQGVVGCGLYLTESASYYGTSALRYVPA